MRWLRRKLDSGTMIALTKWTFTKPRIGSHADKFVGLGSMDDRFFKSSLFSNFSFVWWKFFCFDLRQSVARWYDWIFIFYVSTWKWNLASTSEIEWMFLVWWWSLLLTLIDSTMDAPQDSQSFHLLTLFISSRIAFCSRCHSKRSLMRTRSRWKSLQASTSIGHLCCLSWIAS